MTRQVGSLARFATSLCARLRLAGRTMEQIARGVQALGIVTLVLGLAAALVRAVLVLVGIIVGEEAYRVVRTRLRASILLGLELLVAANMIRTVAAELSLEKVGVLGLIMLIRTFLRFSPR